EQGRVLVELTERPYRRQDCGRAAEPVGKGAAQGAGRTPRRHVDRRRGKRQRIAVVRKTRNDAAIEKRLGQRFEEIRTGGNRQNPRHCAPSAAMVLSASPIASGVPTVIQCPCMSEPNRRPLAMALSK